jgi:hypothetical protein
VQSLLLWKPSCRSVNKATAIGTKMTAAATDPTVSHREEQMIEAGKPKRLATRRLMML